MQKKIKYIIIFTLLLALGMIYKQLLDYQEITTTLLQNNTESVNHVKEFEEKVAILITENESLQNKIILLEESLSLLRIEHNNQNFSIDGNSTKTLPLSIEPINNKEITHKLDITPNITIDDENDITGFGLEYTQKF